MTELKVAWVTGASSGIGLGAAEMLLAKGYYVIASARSRDALIKVANNLDHGDRFEALELDVTDRDAVLTAAARIKNWLGRCDVLVNSAGFNVALRRWHDLDPADFDKVIDANLTGTFNTCYAALPIMRSNKRGDIVNIASMAGKLVTVGGGVAYTAAKHAVIALTSSINLAESANGIRACTLCPGEVATPAMARRAVPPSHEEIAAMLTVDEVSYAIRMVIENPGRAVLQEIHLLPGCRRS